MVGATQQPPPPHTGYLPPIPAKPFLAHLSRPSCASPLCGRFPQPIPLAPTPDDTSVPRRLPLSLHLASLALALFVSCALAQLPEVTAPSRPVAAGRIVAFFGFEERESNPGEVPTNWYRAQDAPGGQRRTGFPEWNKGTLVFSNPPKNPATPQPPATAFQGEGSVLLSTRGGGTSLILSAGVVPIFQDADYRVTAQTRSQGLSHAQPFLRVRVLDSSNRFIPGAEFESTLPSTGEWSTLSVSVPRGTPDAAYLQLELLVLQPRQFRQGKLGDHEIWPQDLSGGAYFDNVTVSQPPRVNLSLGTATNIIAGPQEPIFTIAIRDMTGEALQAIISITDIDGAEVDRRRFDLLSGLLSTSWKPAITRFGWYTCTLKVLSAGEHVGGASTTFCYIPPRPALGRRDQYGSVHRSTIRHADRARFGIDVTHTHPQAIAMLGDIADQLDIGHLTLPVLHRSITFATASSHSARLFPSIDRLLAADRTLTFSISPVPDAIAAALGILPSDSWALCSKEPARWMPLLAPLLDRYGQRVASWRIGASSDAFGPLVQAEVVERGAIIATELATLVSSAKVLLPVDLPAVTLLPGALGPSVAACVVADAESTPHQIEAYITSIMDAPGRARPLATESLVLPLLPADLYAGRAVAAETVKRMIAYWATIHRKSAAPPPSRKDLVRQTAVLQTPRLDLEQLWNFESDKAGPVQPKPELVAWLNTVDRLAGRRMAGKFPVPPGVVCWILAPAEGQEADGKADRASGRAGGALVLWNESCMPGEAVLRAALGQGSVTVVDMAGNISSPLRTVDHMGFEEVVVPAGNDPVFIEGIDIEFTRFLAGIRVEPSLLESNNSRHELQFTVENPWAVPLTGRMNLLRPGGQDVSPRDRAWRVSPRSFTFTVPPGSTGRFPFFVSFSSAEEVGPKDFVMELALAGEHQYRPVLVTRRMEVGLADLSMDLSYQELAQGEVVVEVAISNSGRRNRTLNLTSFAPDLPRMKTSVSDFVAGTQTIRRFTYPGGYEQLKGKRVLVTASDSQSEAQLTKSVLIK